MCAITRVILALDRATMKVLAVSADQNLHFLLLGITESQLTKSANDLRLNDQVLPAVINEGPAAHIGRAHCAAFSVLA